MLEHDITDYEEVTSTLFLFSRNKERVLDEMRAGTYEPPSLSEAQHQ
jgi:hypothetical protein